MPQSRTQSVGVTTELGEQKNQEEHFERQCLEQSVPRGVSRRILLSKVTVVNSDIEIHLARGWGMIPGDYVDAEAIAEAVQRPRMHFVPIKSEEQLDLQALHRVRERWVMRRTAVVNQIRSLLLERGLTLPKGRRYVEEALPRILEDAEFPLSGSFRLLLAQLKLELEQLEQLSARIDQLDVAILERVKEDEACQRLTTIPGAGPVTATP